MIKRIILIALLLMHAGTLFAQEYSCSDCGKYSTRIVGGIEASSGDWPWMVALVKSYDPSNYSAHFCGGSLIDSRWVVTAAHCLVDNWGRRMYSASELNVLAGTNDLSGSDGTRVGVKRIIIHPQYDPNEYKNDIALIELATAVNSETLPVFEGDGDLAGLNATAIGWGNTSASGSSYPKKLRQVILPIISNTVCSQAYRTSGSSIYDCMVCAGYAEGGKDTCDGDSGGPLVISEDSTWKLVGVTSWGEGCAQPGYYGVYSRISALRSFVESYVPSASIGGCVVTPESISISTSTGNLPHVGDSVTFKTEIFSSCNRNVYYRYSYCPDYGSASYDPANGWIQMSSGADGFSSSGTMSYAFSTAGNYVIVAWVCPDKSVSDPVSMIGASLPVLP